MGWTCDDAFSRKRYILDDFDECASSPCQNNGTCLTDQFSTFSCSCDAGWTGVACTGELSSCLVAYSIFVSINPMAYTLLSSHRRPGLGECILCSKDITIVFFKNQITSMSVTRIPVRIAASVSMTSTCSTVSATEAGKGPFVRVRIGFDRNIQDPSFVTRALTSTVHGQRDVSYRL